MIALQRQEGTINKKALAWTVGVHALLLLLFFFLRYSITPIPPVTTDEGGMEVNLGSNDNGSGNDQPMSTKKPAPYQASVVYKSVATKSNIPNEIVRSTEADAPEVDNAKKEKKNTPAPDNNKAIAKPVVKPQEKPKYTYAGDNGAGGNSAAQNKNGTSEGNTTGPGDRGVPGGTPGAANYTGIPGGGTGGRIAHTLTGRKISPDKFTAEFHEGGKVVIRVTVDKAGNIISKSVVSSSSPELKTIALNKLANAKFSPSDGSEPEQHGLITINFITRQ